MASKIRSVYSLLEASLEAVTAIPAAARTVYYTPDLEAITGYGIYIAPEVELTYEHQPGTAFGGGTPNSTRAVINALVLFGSELLPDPKKPGIECAAIIEAVREKLEADSNAGTYRAASVGYLALDAGFASTDAENNSVQIALAFSAAAFH